MKIDKNLPFPKFLLLYSSLLSAFVLAASSSAQAFCGFYVGKADASLYNEASQVIIARHDNKTVISMMNDYQGPLKEFALVVPVPEVLKEGQINIGEKKIFDHLDAFTSPRLVEYFDHDPCEPVALYEGRSSGVMMNVAKSGSPRRKRKSYGVKIEAEYTIGEYDIVILSAKESDGLENWLIDNGYNIPKGARAALKPYIKQDMKFFVAKVNLKKQAKTGLKKLRPLQFAFQSEKFMLPIRLGLINAKGPQELLVYVLSKKGRVETTNYRTVKLPTGMDIPVYVKNDFGNFYKAMFDTQVEKDGMKTVFTEYFWNMGWCDPCAAEPLSREELKKLGVFWMDNNGSNISPRRRPMVIGRGAVPVMVTRLHLRYTGDSFPEDLMFQETNDTTNFQGRYVLRHAWEGSPNKCESAKTYLEKQLPQRQEKEAAQLANLTGWDINDIRKKMDLKGPNQDGTSGKKDDWWKGIWKNDY